MALPPQMETIESTTVLPRTTVIRVDTHEALKIKASLWFAAATLLIATTTLIMSVIYQKPELQTWATGIISAISGAALGYGLNSRQSH